MPWCCGNFVASKKDNGGTENPMKSRKNDWVMYNNIIDFVLSNVDKIELRPNASPKKDKQYISARERTLLCK